MNITKRIVTLIILSVMLLIATGAHATPPIEGTTAKFAASDIVSDADAATSADNARSVFAADMDNDGDMDILSA